MPFKKILVANRSGITIRVFRAANQLGTKTVAIWAEEDKLALHRFNADESYLIGRGPHLARDLGPVESYLSIEEVIVVARLFGAEAIHPGYRLLSKTPHSSTPATRSALPSSSRRPTPCGSWATRSRPATWRFRSAYRWCPQHRRCRTTWPKRLA